jgi:cytoskeletal protein CcmA (bactofilin family)
MFESKQRGTVIAKGLKIVGSVTAEGLVEVNGQIDGELHCTSLVIARGAHVTGTVAAEHVVVDGTVEGPIQGGEVILKSQAHVVGDIHHQSLAIKSGAFFDGRSLQIRGNGQTPEKLERKSVRQIANTRETVSRRTERTETRSRDCQIAQEQFPAHVGSIGEHT